MISYILTVIQLIIIHSVDCIQLSFIEIMDSTQVLDISINILTVNNEQPSLMLESSYLTT